MARSTWVYKRQIFRDFLDAPASGTPAAIEPRGQFTKEATTMAASVNAWKVATIVLAVVATSLATALVVGHLKIPESRADVREGAARKAPSAAMQAAADTCNQRAAAHAPLSDTTTETITDVLPGAGTLYGLNERRKGDERYRAAYARCMRAHGFLS
jgi:hypothetical protein